MFPRKFDIGDFELGKRWKFVAALLLLSALPTSALADNLCPRVFPNPDMEIVKVRPLPNDQWGISYFGPGFAGEQAVAEGKPKFQFGLIEWYHCDVTNPPPPTVEELKEFAKLIQKMGPTDTQYRPLTTKGGSWDEKIAQLAEPSKKQPEPHPGSIAKGTEQIPTEYSTGHVNMYVVAAENIDADSELSKFGLLNRDIIVGSDNSIFKNEIDAAEKVQKIRLNLIESLNVVRQGKFIVLRKMP